MNIIKQMIDEKINVKTFDPWVPGEVEDFNEIAKLGSGSRNIKGHDIYIVYMASGGSSIGAYPEMYTVFLLRKF